VADKKLDDDDRQHVLNLFLSVGREYYLDLSFLAADPALARSFLQQVHHDLEYCGPSIPMMLLREQKQGPSIIGQEQALSIRSVTRRSSPRTEHPEILKVDFETVLKYVEIPCIDSVNEDKPSIEACCILYWLYLCKGVRTILELRFNGLRRNSHSEENIEHTLAGLEVEELDWRREDWSVLSVRQCTLDVERLHLYASVACLLDRSDVLFYFFLWHEKLKKATKLCRHSSGPSKNVSRSSIAASYFTNRIRDWKRK